MKRHHSILSIALLPALALALAGCVSDSMDISSGSVPGGSLGGMKTYGWASDAGSSIRDPKIRDPGLLDEEVRSSMDSQLSDKGYTLAAPRSADFLVTYQVSVMDTATRNMTSEDFYTRDPGITGNAGDTAVGSGAGWGGYAGGDASGFINQVPNDPIVNIESQGGIMVEIKDPGTGKLIWRGNARTVVDPSESEAGRRAIVHKAINGIMSDFPSAG